MGIRTLARQRALQLLYALDFAALDDSFAEVERLFLQSDPQHRRGWGPFARQLAAKVYEERRELDQAILPFLRNWKLDRLPCIDRLCLRMALCELRSFADIPLRVTINEYIELTRLFSTNDSPQYVNAVLDQLAKEFSQKDFQKEGTQERDASDPPSAGQPVPLALSLVPEPAHKPVPRHFYDKGSSKP